MSTPFLEATPVPVSTPLPLPPALLKHAEATIAQGSQSFAKAARLFDPATRASAVLLYAWCRHADDVIDGQELGHHPAGHNDAQDSAAMQARLHHLRQQTHAALTGQPVPDIHFQALAAVAARHGIPETEPQALLDGFAMDAAHARYNSLNDTLRYAYHVAGVVGLMMARIMGGRRGQPSSQTTLNRAVDLGLAMQLSNIARDVMADAALGRIYLPEDWLREAGVPPEHLPLPQHRAAVATVARRLTNVAETYYASAQIGLSALPLRSAWAVATALLLYRDIGRRVACQGTKAWDTRQSTSKAQKLIYVLAGGVLALASRLKPDPQSQPRPAQLWTYPGPSESKNR